MDNDVNSQVQILVGNKKYSAEQLRNL